MIYTPIHERDPIPCRTTYIEFRSPVKIFINFLRNTTQLHWFSLQNSSFSKFYDNGRGGYPSVRLKNSFLIQYKKKLIISGDPFLLLKRSSLGTSDIQGCYSPREITYIWYIPLYVEETQFLRSPVKIFINFLRNTTQFHWFSLQNIFFHSSAAPVVGGTLRWAWKNPFF